MNHFNWKYPLFFSVILIFSFVCGYLFGFFPGLTAVKSGFKKEEIKVVFQEINQIPQESLIAFEKTTGATLQILVLSEPQEFWSECLISTFCFVGLKDIKNQPNLQLNQSLHLRTAYQESLFVDFQSEKVVPSFLWAFFWEIDSKNIIDVWGFVSPLNELSQNQLGLMTFLTQDLLRVSQWIKQFQKPTVLKTTAELESLPENLKANSIRNYQLQDFR